VEDGDRRDVVGIGQVAVEGGERIADHQALVHDRPAREGRDVRAAEAARPQPALDALAGEVQQPLVAERVEPRGPGDQDLAHDRTPRTGLLAQGAVVDRRVAPRQLRERARRDLGVDHGVDLVDGRVVGHEEGAYAEVAVVGEGHALGRELPAEQRVRHLGEDAGAVAGAAVGGHGAAMGEVAKCGEAWSRTWRRGPPSSAAMKPTPQASRSAGQAARRMSEYWRMRSFRGRDLAIGPPRERGGMGRGCGSGPRR
jgi:hypothetical protein